MDREELEEMLKAVKHHGGTLSGTAVAEVLESHLALQAKFDRVTSCR